MSTSFEGFADHPLWAESAAIGPSIDEQRDRWREFVLREIARVMNLAANINPRLFDSWALRKAVRIGAPYETVQWLSTYSDMEARQHEALRYAVADVDHPKMLAAVLAGRPMPQTEELLLWAALASNWPVLHTQLAGLSGDKLAVAEKIISTCRVPSSQLPPGVAFDDTPMEKYPLAEKMRALWTADDADNYPTATGLDVRVAGLELPADAESLPMSEWLPPSADNKSYAEALSALIAKRFSEIKLLGSGTYGIVFGALDMRLRARVAVKVSILRDPTNQTPQRTARHAQAELAIMLRMEKSVEYSRSFPVSVRLLDWTRGRIDLHEFLDRIGNHADAKRYAPGMGIYQLIEMTVFDITLQQWLRTLAGKSDELITAWLAALLAQLLTLYRLFKLRHNDIKADNVMLWNLRTRSVLLRGNYAVNVNISGSHHLRLQPAQMEYAVPSLMDFGLARVEEPTPIGHRSAEKNRDVERILRLFPHGVAPPWVDRALETVTNDTEADVVRLFSAHPELSGLLRVI